MSERMPDISPSINVSTSYGHYLNSFDVDVNGIVHYLRTKGVSDEQIESLTIDFSDIEKTVGGKHNLLGEYDVNTDAITLYPVETLRSMSRNKFYAYDTVSTDSINKTLVHELEHKIAKYDADLQDKNVRWRKKMARKVVAILGWRFAAGAGLSMAIISSPLNDVLTSVGMNGTSSKVVELAGAVCIGLAVSSNLIEKADVDKHKHYAYINEPEEKYVREVADASEEKFIEIQSRYVDFDTPESLKWETEVHKYLLEYVEKGGLIVSDDYITLVAKDTIKEKINQIQKAIDDFPQPLHIIM